jgi:hypothetical protein
MGIVTERGVWRMVRTMTVLRHNVFPLIAALLAALAVLFVSTVSMACEAPVDPGAAVMSMDVDSGPCEQKTTKVVCQRRVWCFAKASFRKPMALQSPAPMRLWAIHQLPTHAPTSRVRRKTRLHEPDPVTEDQHQQSTEIKP